MVLIQLERKRAAQRTAVSKRLKKIEEFTDDAVQFLTIVEDLQNKFNILTELNESIITALTEEEDYKVEFANTDDYMLELKLHIKVLETRHKQLAADVIPLPMLNSREPPQYEHNENTNNSRSKMPMLNSREPPQDEHYENTNISRTTNTANCQEITSGVTDITSANENNASNIYIGNIYINFGQQPVLQESSHVQVKSTNTTYAPRDFATSGIGDRTTSGSTYRVTSCSRYRATTSSRDRASFHTRDRATSHACDRATSYSTDSVTSNSRNRATSHSSYRATSDSSDRVSSDSADHATSSSTNRPTSRSRDRVTSGSRDRSSSVSSDGVSSDSRDRATSSFRDRATSCSRVRATSCSRDRSSSHSRDRASSKSSDHITTGSQDHVTSGSRNHTTILDSATQSRPNISLKTATTKVTYDIHSKDAYYISRR